jgi:hypothetical protein
MAVYVYVYMYVYAACLCVCVRVCVRVCVCVCVRVCVRAVLNRLVCILVSRLGNEQSSYLPSFSFLGVLLAVVPLSVCCMCTFNHAIVAVDGEDYHTHNFPDYDSHNVPDYNNPNIIANGTAFHLNAVHMLHFVWVCVRLPRVVCIPRARLRHLTSRVSLSPLYVFPLCIPC